MATVLEITQDVLSQIDGDEVNSINDTIESLQIANEVVHVFDDIVAHFALKGEKTLFQLTASGDADIPTHMTVPDNLDTLDWIKYDKQETGATKTEFTEVCSLPTNEFIDLVHSRDSSDSTIKVVTDPASSVPLYIKNDIAPQYWTSFDDKTIVFDAYDTGVDSTLQTSKTACYGRFIPTLTLADTSVIDLPDNHIPLLRREVLGWAFALYKQTILPKAEQASRRHRNRLGAGGRNRLSIAGSDTFEGEQYHRSVKDGYGRVSRK